MNTYHFYLQVKPKLTEMQLFTIACTVNSSDMLKAPTFLNYCIKILLKKKCFLTLKREFSCSCHKPHQKNVSFSTCNTFFYTTINCYIINFIFNYNRKMSIYNNFSL